MSESINQKSEWIKSLNEFKQCVEARALDAYASIEIRTIEVKVISIPDGEVLAGEIPGKQLKMMQAWIAIHSEELMVDWILAVNGDEPFRIAPLQ